MLGYRTVILIVRHGPKRGREPRYNESHLKAVQHRAPSLYRRLRFYETGNPPPSLDGIGAVVFWLGDPLRERYPECFADAVTIADAARARGLILINPPEALSNSIKSVQSGLWRAAGIPTPPYARCEDRDALADYLGAADLPVLVRRDEQHGQRPTRVCRNRTEAASVVKEWTEFPCSIAPFIDVRQMFRDAGLDGISARYHHNKRVLVLGSVLQPERMYFSKSPIVCRSASTYTEWERLPYLRRKLSPHPPSLRDCLQAEVSFREAETEAPELMQKAVDTLGMQYAAIDYCSLPDGRVLLWEANPYFQMASLKKAVLWRERRLREHHAVIQDALADFFRGLVDRVPNVEA